MKKHRFLKKFVSTLLVLAMVFAGSSEAFAIQNGNMKEDRGNFVDLVITNIPENQTLTVSAEYEFNAEIAEVSRGFGRVSNGIIRWETAEDTAGVGEASEDGVVYPTKAGSFTIRALYFQNEKKYLSWLENKERNSKSILGTSEWYAITVRNNTFSIPVITLNGNPVVFRDINEPYIDQGATAYDSIDGDITDKIVVNGADISGNWPNENYVYYDVYNSLGYYAYAGRMVVSADLTQSQAPVIKLSYIATEIPLGGAYEAFGVVAWDYEDGDITDRLVVGGETVDVNTPGRYDITFDVTDSDGNASVQKMVSVIVQEDMNNPKDYFAPGIDLYGSQTYYMNPGDTFVEEGYYAWDNYDGDITDKVVINSNLDVNVPGTYQITYDVSDLAGNAAQAVRTVIVIDNIPPVITFNGGPVIFMTVGEPFIEPGITAYDNVDGDISDRVELTDSYLDTSSIGEGYQYYRVMDSSGNYGYAARLIIVSAPNTNVAPVIIINHAYNYLVQIGTPYIEAGAVAYDDKDGDISANIIIGGDTVDIYKEGIYYVTYDVQDSDGQSAMQALRKVVVTDLDNPMDYNPPEIMISGSYYMELQIGDTYTEPGYTALDDRDGDITDRVTVEGIVDSSTPGYYTLTYKVKDSAGNEACAYRSVNVLNKERVYLNGDRIMFLTKGQQFIDPGVTVFNSDGVDVSSQVIIEGTVDINTPGTYEIVYNNEHLFVGYSYDLRRTVVVSESGATVAPVIVLNIPEMTIPIGEGSQDWLQWCYLAFDDKEGNITDRVIIGGDTVDFNKLGTYTVTYDVRDLEGNAAEQKVLTVNITDPAIQYSVPVINLNGDPVVFLTVGDTYTDPGVTCIDTVDGDISDKVEIIMSDVDTSSPGTYYQLYQVYNSGGYYGFNARCVVVSEPGAPLPPVFYLSSIYYPQMVQIGTAYEPQIIRAYDKKDGDITNKVVIGGDIVDSSKEGIYYVTYDVQNSEGLNADQFTIKVVVTDLNNPIDYTAPELQLLGDIFINLNQGDTFTEPGYIATDDRDGDVTSRVTVEGSVDTNTAGFYQLIYRVSDNAGNETIRFRDIYVNSPVSYESVYLHGDRVMFLTTGQEFIDPGVTVINTAGEDVTSQVIIEGTVNTDIPGTYEIYYNNEHLFTGYRYDLRRTVVVSETNVPVAPVIVLSAEGMTIQVGTGSADWLPTYWAYDDKEGNITDKVAVGGDTVDFNTIGTYVITYNVSDLEGNKAEQKTVTINIVESY